MNDGKIRGNVKASALFSTISCVNLLPLEKLERASVFVCGWKTDEAIMVPHKEV
jgi:hypothetical protein